MKKIVRLIIIFLLLFSLFLYFYLRPTSYTLSYNIDNINITEEYLSKEKNYKINITVDDLNFPYLTPDKYTHKRNLIKEVKVTEENDSICIDPKSDYLTLYPLCIKDNELFSYSAIVKNDNNIKIGDYDEISIYDLNNQTFLLWNYHNLIYLNAKDQKKYQLFDKDLYTLKLVYATDRYLFIPNQENDYTFTKAYIIDSKKNKLKDINLNREIYFDSYILGSKKNNIYLVDRKNTLEYEINLKKGKLKKTEGKILKNNKWESISLNKLIHNDYTFEISTFINYEIIDDYLYAIIGDNKIKITNDKVSTIIKMEEDGIYFLIEDTLYYFNLKDGLKKLLSYREWEFNYNNMIFIFN